MDILKTLVREGYIDDGEADTVRQQVRDGDASIEAILEKRGVSPADVRKVKADAAEMPTYELGDRSIPYEVLEYIPEESARHYKIVPLEMSDGVLKVGVVDPDNIDAVDALNFITNRAGLSYKLFVVSEADFRRVLEMYKGLTGKVSQALSEYEPAGGEKPEDGGMRVDTDLGNEEEVSAVEGEEIEEGAPVTKIVATILRHAVQAGASDVHIEPTQDEVRVRFRIDGVLSVSLTLPLKVHAAVVARVKILSSMRLDEKRKPQDGRFSASIHNRRVDFRVSTFPAYHGEKVVMRILDTEKGIEALEETGAHERTIKKLRAAARAPHGMILLSGPTGSGKTTTLYAMLNAIDRSSKNVVSLEDPVEYDIAGVSQAEVKPEIGFTFANGLRTTLRQDPDVIMVGEIRDAETARLAVQASLTGHLVLSTIHTNSAIGVIPRLIDMGIERYLIAPTLNLAVAQRLVRTLCEGSGKRVPVEASLQAMLEDQFRDLPEQYRRELPAFDAVYEAESTSECPDGTRGRTAVFELLEVTDEIEEAVLNSGTEEAIWEMARKRGMMTMRENAIVKALQGIIPFEEVNTLGGQMMETDPAAPENAQGQQEEARRDTEDNAMTDVDAPKA